MSILDDRVRAQVRQAFADLSGPVRLIFFERNLECDTCPEALGLARELAGLSDRIHLDVHNVVTDKDKAREFRVEDAPVLVVAGERDHGIRYYGVPGGYEFGTLVETIRDVSAGRVPLEAATVETLRSLTAPVHLRVFVTPT